MDNCVMYGLVFLLTLLLLYLWNKVSGNNQPGKTVPGPPLLEGIRVFMKGSRDSSLYLQLPNWASKYGDIMQVNLLVRKVIFVNDANTFRRLVKDLDLRDFTNDRPPTFFAHQFMGGQKDIMLAHFSPHLQQKRKIFHSILHFYGEGRSNFEQLMIKTLTGLRESLTTKDTVELPICIREYILSLIGFLLNGDISETAKKDLSKLMAVSDTANKMFLFQNETILQPFPFLSALPGLPFKTLTDELWAALRDMYSAYFDAAKNTFHRDHKRGLVDEMLAKQREFEEDGSDFQLDDDSIKAITVDVVTAAYLTTSSTLTSLFLYLIKHQDVQDRVYNEIKKVIRDSTPSFDHKQHMPFTTAVILETFRISSVVPLPVPHMTRKDITFDGYFIPKSTIIILNVWYSHNRQDVWKDPFTFKPDRFLNAEGQLLDASDPVHQNLIPFGSGRRACPGEAFGKSRIFLFATYMLQNFQFLPDEKESTLPSSDTRDWRPQTILCPENFKCKIVAR